MLNVDPPIAGFTTWFGEGHGSSFASASPSEQVRGRVKRTMLVAVLPRDTIPALLDLIAYKAPLPHLTYWVEAITDFGQLKRAKGSREPQRVFLPGETPAEKPAS
jgi:hypothetical protein